MEKKKTTATTSETSNDIPFFIRPFLCCCCARQNCTTLTMRRWRTIVKHQPRNIVNLCIGSCSPRAISGTEGLLCIRCTQIFRHIFKWVYRTDVSCPGCTVLMPYTSAIPHCGMCTDRYGEHVPTSREVVRQFEDIETCQPHAHPYLNKWKRTAGRQICTAAVLFRKTTCSAGLH